MRPLQIGQRRVGPGEPCFVIAEAGVNHNGNVDLALELVAAAAASGADAVKFQTFSAERLASGLADMADYQKRNTGSKLSQLEMLKALELPESAYPALLAACRKAGIQFLSSPFDEQSADLLQSHDVPAFKIPSGEITNLAYLAHIARNGKPMIISTGMATMAEIAAAIDAVRDNGDPPVCLLQCVSDYPARASEQNLRVMRTLELSFGVPAGFSDHTVGFGVTAAAVALGACIVEKHFTLGRNLPGPDHKASLSVDELKQMVAVIRDVEAALGDGVKRPQGPELETRIHARKSLMAAREISKGAVIAAADVVARRPGTGISPAQLGLIVGRRANRSIAAGTLLSWDHVS